MPNTNAMNCSTTNKALFGSLFILILLITFSSCDPSRRISDNNKGSGSTYLDPVVGKNTDPKDTVTTGNYTAVTNVDPEDNNTTTTTTNSTVDTIRFCDTTTTATQQIVVCYQKVAGQSISADTVSIINLNPNAVYTTTVVDSTIKQKLAYKVVILMPFMSKGFVPAPTKEIPVRSIKAIEFYEGALLALDSLKSEGVNLFVEVFDSQRDTTVVKDLLTKRSFQEADLIIGPIITPNVRLVAEFAKTNEKTFISPFNSRGDITKDNPYYVQINPSFGVHSKTIIEHIHQIESEVMRTPMEKNMLILGMEYDSVRVAALQESYANYKNDINATLPTLIRNSPTIDIEDIKPSLQKDKLNIIVMPTYRDEGFVYNCLREIQKLVDKVEQEKGYQIVLVGMDRWKYYTRINFEYFESMNLHLTSQYFTDLDEEIVQKFKSSYKALYGIGSREFSFIGFDVMLYAGRMLQKYGVNFPAHLWKETTKYRHTTFDIAPRYEVVAPIDGSDMPKGATILNGYQNQYLHFLEFNDYRLQPIKIVR